MWIRRGNCVSKYDVLRSRIDMASRGVAIRIDVDPECNCVRVTHDTIEKGGEKKAGLCMFKWDDALSTGDGARKNVC